MRKITNINSLYKNYPFLNRASASVKGIVEREKYKFENHQTKDFSFVGANLNNFIPSISYDAIKDTYMNLHINRTLMLIESKAENSTQYLDSNFQEVVKDNSPKIFCTYHLGPYRAPIALLIKENVDFVMLLDAPTIKKQSQYITTQIEVLKKEFNSTSKIELLNVENDNILFKIIKYTKRNFSVLAYIDGNSGGKGVYHKSKNLQTQVNFLDNHILVRNGLAAISYLANIPIYPIISYRPKQKDVPPKVSFETPIIPDKTIASRLYIDNTTKALYKVLETYVEEYFDQWEPWFYIHKYLDFEKIANNTIEDIPATKKKKKLVFNVKDFALFKIEEDCYLLNKKNYLSFSIEEEIFDKLKVLEDKSLHKVSTGKLKWLKRFKFYPRKVKFNAITNDELQHSKVLIYE